MAVAPNLALTPNNAAAVAGICRRLDGMPLAVELAAAKAKVLSLGQISARLDHSFALLRGGSRSALPRHQTLRATMDWSHSLLSEEERILFRRLSVFVGGFALEAAEAVCAGGGIEEDGVFDPLSRLVDKSLVGVEAGPEGAMRYVMLEPIRQYGREKLEESGEADAVRGAHTAFFLALTEEAAPQLKGPRQVVWLDRLDRERDNLRAAMRWLLDEGGSEAAARLGWALWLFWAIRGPYAEGRRWMEEALAKGGTAMPASARAKALYVAGTMAPAQGDYGSAAALLEESITLFRELGDKRGAAYALCSAGFVESSQGQYERGSDLLEEAADLSLEAGDRWCATYTLSWLALLWRNRGDHARAKQLAERGLGFSREVGDKEGISTALYILAGLARASGEHKRAQGLFEEAMVLSAEVGDEAKVAHCLEELAAIAGAEGRTARAALLWGAAEAFMEKGEAEVYAYVYAPDHSLNQSQLAAARARLDEVAFEAAWTEGRAMAPEQAVAYALGETTTPREEEGAYPPTAGKASAGTRGAPELLRVFALGAGRVYRGERALAPSDWTYAKSRELLFYLLSHPPRMKEQIGLDLWPDASPERLRRSLHDALYHLRRAVGDPEWIVFEKGRYSFNRSLDHCFDVEAFESELAEARRRAAEAPERAIAHLERAAGLYGGDFLEDLAVEGEWALIRREELGRAYGEALLALGRLLSQGGRHAEAAEAYRKAIAHDELLEAAHRGLMRCLARQGERGRAMRHYRDLDGFLREELGSTPAAETTALYESLRRGEEV